MGITRLFIPLYLYGYPHNFLNLLLEESESPFSFDPLYCLVILSWVSLQIGILYSQKVKGPRHFIPARFLPAKYDYRRPIPSLLRDTDCVICMLRVPGDSEGEHMITPCNHLFHSSCLESWLEIKQECPTCRARLPPA